MELTGKDILINCDGYVFVDDKSDNGKRLTLEELLTLTEDLYIEITRLQERIEELEENIEDNYRRIPLNEQYGVSDDDFI